MLDTRGVQNLSYEMDDYLPKRMNTILKICISYEKKLERIVTDE